MCTRRWLLDLYLLIVFMSSGAFASTKTLIWGDDTCGYAAKETVPGKSYRIEFDGKKTYGICNSVAFRGYDKSYEYEVCVEVEEFNVNCGVRLSYRADKSYDPYKTDRQYSCSDNPSDIPKFCSPFETLLYITIDADDNTNSRIVLNVTHGESEGGISDRVWFYLRIAGGIVAFVILMSFIVIGIRKCIVWLRVRRERQERIGRVEREVYGPKGGNKGSNSQSNVDQGVSYSKVLSQTDDKS